jgi:hypothetical protein
MCASRPRTAPSWCDPPIERVADLAISGSHNYPYADVPDQELHRYDDNHIGEPGTLSTKDDGLRTPEASATEPQVRASSSQVRSPQLRIGGSETGAQSDEKKPSLCASGGDHTADASGEGVDGSEGGKRDGSAPTTEGHNDEAESHIHTNVVGLTTPLTVTATEVTQVGDEARLPSGFGASTHSYPRSPYDLDTGVDQVGLQADLSVPMDEDEDESEPPFGVLLGTTFDPLLAYQPHSYSDGLNIEQDDLIVEDTGNEIMADSAMEDAEMESWKAEASVTTETLQPFSWIPTSVASPLHAMFTGVSSNQMTAPVNTGMRILEFPMLSNPYAMGSAISEGASLQQVAPPQDVPWPFISGGAYPLPSIEGEMFKGPESIVIRPSSTSASSVSASQTTGHAPFPPASPPALRAGPLPVLPPVRRHEEEHKEEVKGADGGTDPRPGVAASMKHEASPVRCVLVSAGM